MYPTLEDFNIDHGIDWITATHHYEVGEDRTYTMPTVSEEVWVRCHAIISRLPASFDDGIPHLKMVNPPRYYRYAVKTASGDVMLAWGGQKQGIMIQFHGQYFQQWYGINTLVEIVKNGWKVTRLDYQVTAQYRDEYINVNPTVPLYRARPMGRAIEKDFEVRGIRSPKIGWPTPKTFGEDTVYFGRRTSALFGRIYDKKYWANEPAPAVRWEVEFKRISAKDATDAIISGEAHGLVHFMIGWMYAKGNLIPSWLGMFDDTIKVKIRRAEVREETSREKWFNAVVAKSFKKWAEDDPYKARDWLNDQRDKSAIIKIIDEMGGEIG